jgi:hypothetical protein
MIARIVEKDVDQRAQRIEHLDHPGLAGFQIKRAVYVDPLPSAGLLDGECFANRPPAADRLGSIGRVDGIVKQHSLVNRQSLQQVPI